MIADPRSAAAILGDGKAEAMFERGYREIVGLPSALAAYRSFFATLAAEAYRVRSAVSWRRRWLAGFC